MKIIDNFHYEKKMRIYSYYAGYAGVRASGENTINDDAGMCVRTCHFCTTSDTCGRARQQLKN